MICLSSLQSIVAKYGSQFRGNSQHDALEFLLWLLDRVHEDDSPSANNKSNSSSSNTKTKANAKVSPSLCFLLLRLVHSVISDILMEHSYCSATVAGF